MLSRITGSTVLVFAALAIATPTAAQRPDAGPAVDSAMAPLAWLVGEWEGEGWEQRPGAPRQRAMVRERVEERLAGRVLVVEGIGREPATDGEGRVVHHAFGVLSYDPERRQYSFRAFSEGGSMDAETDLADGVLTWGFAVPGGRIRYQIREEGGEWLETGAFSRDGTTWRQFFEMRLHRVGAAR